MKDKCRMSCFILAAALCAPVAMAAPESTAVQAESTLTALDVTAMTDLQLTTRMGKIVEALKEGNAAKVRSALSGISTSGLSMTDEQVKTVGDQLRDLLAKYPAHEAIIKKELFKVENLTIGRIAPNIKGQDTDGVDFELQDYRGKVVVLDFFGDW